MHLPLLDPSSTGPGAWTQEPERTWTWISLHPLRPFWPLLIWYEFSEKQKKQSTTYYLGIRRPFLLEWKCPGALCAGIRRSWRRGSARERDFPFPIPHFPLRTGAGVVLVREWKVVGDELPSPDRSSKISSCRLGKWKESQIWLSIKYRTFIGNGTIRFFPRLLNTSCQR